MEAMKGGHKALRVAMPGMTARTVDIDVPPGALADSIALGCTQCMHTCVGSVPNL